MILGHKGASATHCCVWCQSKRADQIKPPSPSNRQWKSKTDVTNIQGSISHLTQTNEALQLSQKRLGLLQTGFDRLNMPTMHINLGPTFVILTAIMRIIKENYGDNNNMNEYNATLKSKHRAEIDLHNHQQSLLLLEEMSNESMYDDTFTESLDDKIDRLKREIINLQNKLESATTAFENIKNQVATNNGHAKILALYRQLKIAPWDVKQGSMTGVAGKKFLAKHDIVLDELKKCDLECYKLCKPLCMRLQFWCTVTLSKNLIPFRYICYNLWCLHLYFYFLYIIFS